MVRHDTGIAPIKQGHFQAAFATIAPHRQRVVRRSSKPKQREGPISGQILGNTFNFNENTNHAASREINSEWFWDP